MQKKISNANQGLFFDLNNFSMRKVADQKEFEEKCKDDLREFNKIVNLAFEKTRKERQDRPLHYIGRNWNAITMNSNLKGLLFERYGDCFCEKDGRFFLRMNGYLLFFKKLNKNYMPSHVSTLSSETLIRQLALPLQDPTAIVWIGYQTDNWTELNDVCAVSICGDKKQWVSSLSALESDWKQISINTPKKESTRRTGRVTPKDGTKKRKAE